MYTRHNINFAVPHCGTPLCRALQSPLLPPWFSSLPFVKVAVLFPAALTLCSHWLTLVHNKKNPQEITVRKSIRTLHSKKRDGHEPEKISALPEDERLKPENEPEKNLKIQPPFTTSFARPLRTSRSLRLNTCVSSAISTFPPTTPRHFQHFKATPQKPPPFQLFRFVSFCSAKIFTAHPAMTPAHLFDPAFQLTALPPLCSIAPITEAISRSFLRERFRIDHEPG